MVVMPSSTISDRSCTVMYINRLKELLDNGWMRQQLHSRQQLYSRQ